MTTINLVQNHLRSANQEGDYLKSFLLRPHTSNPSSRYLSESLPKMHMVSTSYIPGLLPIPNHIFCSSLE